MNKIQVLINDSIKLSRESFAIILNNDPRFEVIAQCSETDDILRYNSEKKPNVILINIHFPLFNWLSVISDIKAAFPGSFIVGISSNPLPGYAKKMFQRGATGYVTNNSSTDEVLQAIFEVANGNKYVCEEVRSILCSEVHSSDQEKQASKELSNREMEIIELLKSGLSSKEIANQLCISLRTVEVHRHNILTKLKLKNTVSLINFLNTSHIFA